MAAQASRKVACVIGYGPGIGASCARKWSAEGYAVALISRNAEKLAAAKATIPNSQGFPADVTDPRSLEAALTKVEETFGPIDDLLYNAGSGLWKSYDQVQDHELDLAFKTNAGGLLTAARVVVSKMEARGSGNLVVTGATAALRGKPKTTAFAAAKAAQRSLTQSIARKAMPSGVHVVYAIIDGAVGDGETRIHPDAIADTFFNLTLQPKSCWTFELDMRPFVESW